MKHAERKINSRNSDKVRGAARTPGPRYLVSAAPRNRSKVATAVQISQAAVPLQVIPHGLAEAGSLPHPLLDTFPARSLYPATA